MNRKLGIGAVALAAVAGMAGLSLASKARRERIRDAVGGRMLRRMERMMARMPDNSPPKLVMSVLPQLREQNEQILQLLREQNALLAERQDRATH